MPVKILTLCENTATFGFKAEWGLSMLVEVDDFTFLLDTGMTDVALGNALKRKTPLADIRAIVLSHGHVDHTGGLEGFLAHTGPVDVVAHPDVFTMKYSSRHEPPDEDISIPLSKEAYEAAGARFRLSREPLELAPGIVTSGEVPMGTDFEHIDAGLLVDGMDGRNGDPLADDLSVGVQTPHGLFVLLGCAHRGPVNHIRHLMEVTGEKRLYAVVGGLHLHRANRARVAATVDFFRGAGVKKVACSHCTGFAAMGELEREFPGEFIRNNSGKRLHFN